MASQKRGRAKSKTEPLAVTPNSAHQPTHAERRTEAIQRQRAERRRAAQRQRRQRLVTRLLVGGIVALVLAGLVYVVVNRSPTTTAAPPAGVQTFTNLSRNHVSEHVTYAQNPPVGGDHSPVWQNCGFYAKPVINEHAVHSLEHGAVWITYAPNLPAAQVQTLKQLATQSYVLVSPYPGLPAPVVASAWGKQLKLQSATDPRLNQFVRYFREGPQTPERGGPCTGGTSATA